MFECVDDGNDVDDKNDSSSRHIAPTLLNEAR